MTEDLRAKSMTLRKSYFQFKNPEIFGNPDFTLIPTGHGFNEPIYSFRVTQAGRNRVKATHKVLPMNVIFI